MEPQPATGSLFYKALAVIIVAMLGVYLVNMNENAREERASRAEARRNADLRVGKALSDGPAVISQRRLDGGVMQVVEVPRRSLIGLEIMTCVLYVADAGASSLACGDEGMPVFD